VLTRRHHAPVSLVHGSVALHDGLHEPLQALRPGVITVTDKEKMVGTCSAFGKAFECVESEPWGCSVAVLFGGASPVRFFPPF